MDNPFTSFQLGTPMFHDSWILDKPGTEVTVGISLRNMYSIIDDQNLFWQRLLRSLVMTTAYKRQAKSQLCELSNLFSAYFLFVHHGLLLSASYQRPLMEKFIGAAAYRNSSGMVAAEIYLRHDLCRITFRVPI